MRSPRPVTLPRMSDDLSKICYYTNKFFWCFLIVMVEGGNNHAAPMLPPSRGNV